MKNKYILIFISILMFLQNLSAENIKFVDSSSEKLKQSLAKKIIKKSAGHRFLENNLKSNSKIMSVQIEEIFSKKVSGNWNGAIFNVVIKTYNDEIIKDNMKLFYNDELVVKDIFSTDGKSMIKLLKLPLLSKEKAYNENFLVLKKKDGKVSDKGSNMVIVSDPQCPFCMDRVPDMLDYAKKHNMNVYYYDLPLPIASHVNSRGISECITTAIAKNKGKATLIIKNTYNHDFGDRRKNLKTIIKEFNKYSGVAEIRLEDVKNEKASEHVRFGEKIVKELYIQTTPTIYVDGKSI